MRIECAYSLNVEYLPHNLIIACVSDYTTLCYHTRSHTQARFHPWQVVFMNSSLFVNPPPSLILLIFISCWRCDPPLFCCERGTICQQLAGVQSTCMPTPHINFTSNAQSTFLNPPLSHIGDSLFLSYSVIRPFFGVDCKSVETYK